MWLLKSMISLLLTILLPHFKPSFYHMDVIHFRGLQISYTTFDQQNGEVKLESRMIGGNYLANYELGALTIQTWILRGILLHGE